MMPPTKREQLLTPVQAAEMLHIGEGAIRKYVRDGDLKAYRVAGVGAYRIRVDDLMKLLQPIEPSLDGDQ